MDWRNLHRHGSDRGAEFYITALTYSQHLWQRGLAARALLAADRALFSELEGNEPELKQWPLPYLALRWIMAHSSEKSLVGNPRVHYQHLAARLRGSRAQQRRARAWAAWYLARIVNPDWAGDPKYRVQEPSKDAILEGLLAHGIPKEDELWLKACVSK